jgi:hypothetical protein
MDEVLTRYASILARYGAFELKKVAQNGTFFTFDSIL